MQYPSETDSSRSRLVDLVFQAEGELARLCRDKDWSATPLGPIELWPASLRTIASLVIAAPAPMIVLWGPELVQIYNDGYRDVMGSKHPKGLGQSTRECWPEVWEFNAPLYEGVVTRRETYRFEDQRLVIERHGHSEEAYFTLTYSPATDDGLKVGGVLVTVFETTGAVERLKAQEAQRESEERLRIAIEAADLGAWDLDLTADRAPIRSLRHDQIFGYTELQTEWGQEIAMRHVLPEDQALFEKAFARAAEIGALSVEVRVRWPDGSIHWIEIFGRTYYDSEERPVRMAGVVADVTERNQTEALRQSEERFRLMADAVPQIVWVTDHEGRTEFFNRQWSAYTGKVYKPATAGETAAAVVHPEDAAVTMARFEEAQRCGHTFLVEHRLRSAAGDYRWFLVRAEPYRDPSNGQITRWFGVSVDIHDHKLAEQVLRQAAEINAFRVDLDHGLRSLASPVEIQSAAARLLGEHLGASRAHYAEISNDGEYALVHADYCDGVASVVGRYRLADYVAIVMSEARAGRTLVMHRLAEDTRLSVAEREATAAIDVAALVVVPLTKGGRAVAIFVIHQSEPRVWTETEVALMETTAERTWAAVERAHADAALRESETKYRTLFDSIDEGFLLAEVIFDSGGKLMDISYLDANPAAIRMLGQEYSGRRLSEIDPNFESNWFEIFGRVAKDGEAVRMELYAEAQATLYDFFICKVGDATGNRLAVVFSDITERRRTEEVLRQNDQRKDEFLAMLAHELRNPLAAIGYTVELLERLAPEGSSRRYLEILHRQTDVLRGLVGDLLDVSRITRGLVELREERVNFAAVADRALESVQSLMDSKRHDVSVMLPRKPVPVMGDPVRLEQILVNLLTNAAKYTDPGGRITLAIERKGDSTELRIRDTGIGMTGEVLERIFELFGQAERGLARSEGGLGIGLTIVKRLVELHGGQIAAHSDGPNTGSEFVVTLPLAAPDEDARPVVPRVQDSAGRPRRVLVVEDSQDLAEMLAVLLEQSGHSVTLAHDGPSALQRAQESNPDVILLDIGLPGMDGYEVARRLRQNPLTRATAVAALTGYGQPSERERAHDVGFDAHFVKPLNIAALEQFVNDAHPHTRH